MRDLKWTFPALPGESKYLVSVKKILAGEGEWNCAKEVLRWILDTEAGIVTLPECKLHKLRVLMSILITQRRMGRKYIKRLVRKLLSMHLAVP